MKLRGEKGKEIVITILSMIAVVGFVSAVALDPNSVQILKLFGKGKGYKARYYFKTRLSQLIDEGYVAVNSSYGSKHLALTERGKLLLEKFRKTSSKPKKWDGKWRVVIFDISEKRRSKRDLLRWELKKHGFKQLQQSVWVTPYPCEDFVVLLKTDLGLGARVVYLETYKIEFDKKIKSMFGL